VRFLYWKRVDNVLMKKNVIAIAIAIAFAGGLSYLSASYLWRIRVRDEAVILWRLCDGLVLLAAILFIYGLGAKTSNR